MLSAHELFLLKDLRSDPAWYSDEEDEKQLTKEELEYQYMFRNYWRFTNNPAKGKFNPETWADKWELYEYQKYEEDDEKFHEYMKRYNRVKRQFENKNGTQWPPLFKWSRFERRRKTEQLINSNICLAPAPIIAGEILRHNFKLIVRQRIRRKQRIQAIKLFRLVEKNQTISPLAHLPFFLWRYVAEFF